MSSAAELEHVYKELSVKIREFVEAGGDCIAWINPGDDAEVHDVIVAANASHIIKMIAELREQLGEENFQMILMAATAMHIPPPAGRSDNPTEWDNFFEKLKKEIEEDV